MKTKCTVCGKRFAPQKESVYLINGSAATLDILVRAKNYDAVDCPRCGCQQVLKIRFPQIKEKTGEDV